MEEIWRDVPGYEGKYQINIDTPEGRCRKIYTNGKIRELNQNTERGRIFWSLTKNKKETFKQAAYWIAITFPELIQNKYFTGAEICHEDNNALNNRPDNLKWGTHKENMNNPFTIQKHSEKMKGKKTHLGKKHSEEAKKKMSKAKKGRTLPEEQKIKIRNSMRAHFKNKEAV